MPVDRRRLLATVLAGGSGGIANIEQDFAVSDDLSQWTAPTGVVSGGVLIITPTLGAEIIANGSFEGTYVSGKAPSWSTLGGTPSEEATIIHGGAKSQKMINGSVYQGAAANGVWTRISAWLYTDATTAYGQFLRNAPMLSNGAWANLIYTDIKYSQSRPLFTGAGTFYLDDASGNAITLNTTMAYRAFDNNWVCEIVYPSLPNNLCSGFCAWTDETFQNGIVVAITYQGGLTVTQYIAGVASSLLGVTGGYAATPTKLRVEKNGLTLTAYYSNIQIGADLTLNSANTDLPNVGFFSTDSSIGISSFSARTYTAPIRIIALGDSKTANVGWRAPLIDSLIVANQRGFEEILTISNGGWTVKTLRDNIDTQLATRTDVADYALIDVGVNPYVYTESTWKADYQYIISALHTKWPSCKIYLTSIFQTSNSYESENQWIADLIGVNAGFCFAGDDERVWLEGGDNGATMTTDGVHYSAAGMTAKVNAVQTAIGL